MEQKSLRIDLALMKVGDKDAFERLYNRYWAKVYNFTSLYINDGFEREEIVQKVFIRFWKMRERIDVEKDPDGLLFIITRNLVFNETHRSANEKALKEAILMDAAAQEDIESKIETDDLSSYIDSLVAGLPKRQREAFELSQNEGLSYKEIAQRMNISEKGVERHLYLARKFIRENLPLFLIFLGI